MIAIPVVQLEKHQIVPGSSLIQIILRQLLIQLANTILRCFSCQFARSFEEIEKVLSQERIIDLRSYNRLPYEAEPIEPTIERRGLADMAIE